MTTRWGVTYENGSTSWFLVEDTDSITFTTDGDRIRIDHTGSVTMQLRQFSESLLSFQKWANQIANARFKVPFGVEHNDLLEISTTGNPEMVIGGGGRKVKIEADVGTFPTTLKISYDNPSGVKVSLATLIRSVAEINRWVNRNYALFEPRNI